MERTARFSPLAELTRRFYTDSGRIRTCEFPDFPHRSRDAGSWRPLFRRGGFGGLHESSASEPPLSAGYPRARRVFHGVCPHGERFAEPRPRGNEHATVQTLSVRIEALENVERGKEALGVFEAICLTVDARAGAFPMGKRCAALTLRVRRRIRRPDGEDASFRNGERRIARRKAEKLAPDDRLPGDAAVSPEEMLMGGEAFFQGSVYEEYDGCFAIQVSRRDLRGRRRRCPARSPTGRRRRFRSASPTLLSSRRPSPR